MWGGIGTSLPRSRGNATGCKQNVWFLFSTLSSRNYFVTCFCCRIELSHCLSSAKRGLDWLPAACSLSLEGWGMRWMQIKAQRPLINTVPPTLPCNVPNPAIPYFSFVTHNRPHFRRWARGAKRCCKYVHSHQQGLVVGTSNTSTDWQVVGILCSPIALAPSCMAIGSVAVSVPVAPPTVPPPPHQFETPRRSFAER